MNARQQAYFNGAVSARELATKLRSWAAEYMAEAERHEARARLYEQTMAREQADAAERAEYPAEEAA